MQASSTEKARRSVPKRTQLEVWRRDRWTCRYCGEPVFFGPTLKLLEQIFPGRGYYHRHGKAAAMLPLFRRRWASVDHVHPVTRGGANDASNYVTACWECNLRYGNRTQTEGKPSPRPVAERPWDGLSSLYSRLAPARDAWTRALQLASTP